MRGIFLLGVILLLMYWGFRKPIIFVLAYVWASIFTPQHVAYSIITSIPISLIFGLAAFVAFLKLQKVPYIRWRSQSVLTGALAIWMTLTLLWAVVVIALFDLGRFKRRIASTRLGEIVFHEETEDQK